MQNIKEIAISSEKRNVRVPIAPDDLNEIKDRYVEKSIEFKKLADEKADSNALFKERMQPIQREISDLMEVIKNEFEEVNSVVYLLDDQDNNLMRYYLEDGQEVYSRPLRPDEKQLNILSIKQGQN